MIKKTVNFQLKFDTLLIEVFLLGMGIYYLISSANKLACTYILLCQIRFHIKTVKVKIGLYKEESTVIIHKKIIVIINEWENKARLKLYSTKLHNSKALFRLFNFINSTQEKGKKYTISDTNNSTVSQFFFFS